MLFTDKPFCWTGRVLSYLALCNLEVAAITQLLPGNTRLKLPSKRVLIPLFLYTFTPVTCERNKKNYLG